MLKDKKWKYCNYKKSCQKQLDNDYQECQLKRRINQISNRSNQLECFQSCQILKEKVWSLSS